MTTTALELANATRYGLAAGVWNLNDLSRAHRFVRALRVGSVWVNTYRKIHWAMPFGGVKDSGFGRGLRMEERPGEHPAQDAGSICREWHPVRGFSQERVNAPIPRSSPSMTT